MCSTITVVLPVLHNSEGSLQDRRQRVGQHDLSLAHVQHFLRYAYCPFRSFSICKQSLELIVNGNCPNSCEGIHHHRNEQILHSLVHPAVSHLRLLH